MNDRRVIATAACIALAAAQALAASPRTGKEPLSFTFKDWELRCDNQRTCRAAGYQAEGGDDPVSLLLTRTAGPATAVEMSLQVGTEVPLKGTLRLVVGRVTVAGLPTDTVVLKPDQARAILPEMLKSDTAQVSGGGKTFTLSLAGLNAVLLKMDEAQGRLNTAGALVRRGTQPESSVLPPLPQPVVANVLPVPTRPTDAALARQIFPALDLADARDQCNQGDKLDAKSLEIHRLTDRKVLVSLSCGMGAYNSSSLLWIANDKPPFAPKAVEADGDFSAEEGSVTSSMKGRGIGDCWWTRTWHFTGTDFALTHEAGDGMCRGFAGGAWSLPSYTARVTQPAKPKKP